jgi:hypothetical protein
MKTNFQALSLLIIASTAIAIMSSAASLDQNTSLQCSDQSGGKIITLNYSDWTATIRSGDDNVNFSFGPQIEGLDDMYISWISIISSTPKVYLRMIGTERGFKAKYINPEQIFPFTFQGNSDAFLKDEPSYDMTCKKIRN